MPNDNALLFRLDVNVARARGDAGAQQIVDETRDGLGVLLQRRLLVVRLGVARKQLNFDVAFTRRGLCRLDGVELRASVYGVDSCRDRIGRCHGESHRSTSSECEGPLSVDVARIRRRDDEHVAIDRQGEDAELPRPPVGAPP